MTDNGRVHPDCANAANPYHECGVACLEKIAHGHGRKDKKKSGSFIEASLSFGRKKKGSESQPRTPREANNMSPAKVVYPSDSPSPRSPFPAKKKVESDNSQSSSSSSQQHSDESFSQSHSFDKGQVPSSEIVPASGILKPDAPKSPKSLSLGTLTCYAIAPPPGQGDRVKVPASPRAASSPTAKNDGMSNARGIESLNFTFSGLSRATEESDDEDILSVISDSCVSVGKYHVRANSASILQLIIDNYGDIAANCRLESASLRTYYLECLCSVVQELQSTSLSQLTKSKVKEFLAVLKDVESAQIDVSWLRSILNGLTQAVELNNKQQAAEEAKTNCDHIIESTRSELQSMTQELFEKEKEVADTKARIEETEAHLRELELESSELSETILSLRSQADKFNSKPLGDQIL